MLHSRHIDLDRALGKGGETCCQGNFRVVERGRVAHLLALKFSKARLDDELFRLSHLRNQSTDAGWVYRKFGKG